jgi:hypothetical protein
MKLAYRVSPWLVNQPHKALPDKRANRFPGRLKVPEPADEPVLNRTETKRDHKILVSKTSRRIPGRPRGG